MSMFVGAVMPRQKTALASAGLRIMVAVKDARAAQCKKSIRMNFFFLAWHIAPTLTPRVFECQCAPSAAKSPERTGAITN
jgi:hypothetical protein